MRRIIPCLLLWALFSSAQAEQVILQSGEHAGFSRIVLQLNPPREWRLGRVPEGYELRIAGPPATFDISRVFEKIPHRRIKNVLIRDSQRLALTVSCACFADAFEIRKGRVVIDIKDGKPQPGSAFEKVLPQLSDHPDWMPGTLAYHASDTLPAGAPITLPAGTTERLVPDLAPSNMPPSLAPDQSPAQTRNNATSDHEQNYSRQPDNRAGSANHTPSHSGNAKADVANLDVPNLLDLPLAQAQRLHEETSETRKALMQQLARTASQGLVNVTLSPERHPATSQGSPEHPSATNEPGQGPETLAPEPKAISLGAHIGTRSAADTPRHDRNNDAPVTTGPSTACLNSEHFDFPGWGPVSSQDYTLDDLRTKLVGEFDTPDPDIIQQLARRYLYFGFGAEARTLLDAFAVPVEDAMLMKELAFVVDEETGMPNPTLASQLGCPGNAGLWALIATPAPPKGTDSNSILLAFSQLPAHLQSNIGPTLANRFIDMGNPEAATAIESILKRKPSPDGAAIALLKARLQHLDGNTAKAADTLARIASTAGPHEAEALISLITNQLEGEKDVPEKFALLADAMSVEHRGTKTGRKLAELAIRAYMKNGNSSLAFHRIAQARRTDELSKDLLDDLYLETHVANARRASAPEFLRAFFAYPVSGQIRTRQKALARRAIATRLNELDLPAQTIRLYDQTHAGPLGPDDLLILAQANLKNGAPEKAAAILKDQKTTKAYQLRAEAYEKLGRMADALEIYRQLSQEPDLVRAAWLGGDWKMVQAHGETLLSDAARIAIQTSKTAGETNQVRAEHGPSAPSISLNRKLIEESRQTREVLARLLASK